MLRINPSVRAFSTSRRAFQQTISNAVPVVKPVRRVGAFRGGFTGFLFGVVVTGGAAYYYLMDEYQAAQRAILTDVVSLRQSLQELQKTVVDLRAQAEKSV